MDIELTETQRQILEQVQGKPVDMVDPTTQRRYVLLAREQYESVQDLLEQGSHLAKAGNPALAVPPGILRSQRAFWRELPDLLKNKRNLGKWVAYHGDERVGIAGTEVELILECLQRGLSDDEYDLDIIEPHARPPWEPERVDRGGHEMDGENRHSRSPGDGGQTA
jgi:hypothetical protein